MTVQTNRNTQKTTHIYQNSRPLTDRWRHMNTATCPSNCQHVHKLRHAHKTLSFGHSLCSHRGSENALSSYPLSIPQVIKMLWERSFQSSPVAALSHRAIIYLHRFFQGDTFRPQDLYMIECNYLKLRLPPSLLCSSDQTLQYTSWMLFLCFLLNQSCTTLAVNISALLFRTSST